MITEDGVVIGETVYEHEAFQTDAAMQELIFLGHLMLHGEQYKPYSAVLTAVDVFTTVPAKYIWRKINMYYKKYSALPDDYNTLGTLLDDKEFPALSMAIDFVQTDPDASRFRCDKFIDSAKLTILRTGLAKAGTQLTLNSQNLDNAVSTLNKLTVDLAKMDNAQLNTGLIKDTDLLIEWEANLRPAQQPVFAIPIPGIEPYFPGTPSKQLNFIIGGSGAGKSSLLSQLAYGMLSQGPIMYVTLELPADNIMSKIVAAAANGLVDSNFIMKKYEEVGPMVQGAVTKYITNASSRNPLYIFDMPSGTTSCLDIARIIRQIKMEDGVTIQGLLVDYADLLITNQGTGFSEDGFSYMIPVMTEMSALCKEFNLVGWTASQTAKGMMSVASDLKTFKPIRDKDVWGSASKMQIGNIGLGLSIYRIPDNLRYGVGCMSVLKDRFQLGASAKDLVVQIDYARSMLFVKGVAEENAVWADILVREINEIAAGGVVKRVETNALNRALSSHYHRPVHKASEMY